MEKNVTSNCEKENFFCKDNKYRVVLILYSLLPLIINFYKILLGIKYKLTTLLLIPSFIAFIYFLFNKKRTKKGNIEYKKWLGLKKYLSEFSNIKNRTMPEVHIWEEYLVYSTVFGISLDNELERGLIDYINVSRFQLVVQKIYILIKEIKRALNFNLDNNDNF